MGSEKIFRNFPILPGPMEKRRGRRDRRGGTAGDWEDRGKGENTGTSGQDVGVSGSNSYLLARQDLQVEGENLQKKSARAKMKQISKEKKKFWRIKSKVRVAVCCSLGGGGGRGKSPGSLLPAAPGWKKNRCPTNGRGVATTKSSWTLKIYITEGGGPSTGLKYFYSDAKGKKKKKKRRESTEYNPEGR